MNKIKNITKIKTFLQNKQNAGHRKQLKQNQKIKCVSRVNENSYCTKNVKVAWCVQSIRWGSLEASRVQDSKPALHTHTPRYNKQTNTHLKSTESSSTHMWRVSRLDWKCEDRKTMEHETHTNIHKKGPFHLSTRKLWIRRSKKKTQFLFSKLPQEDCTGQKNQKESTYTCRDSVADWTT